MNPLFDKSGITPTASLAHRAKAQQGMVDFRASQQAIRAERGMPSKFENRNTVERSMASRAKMNARKASLGKEVTETTRPARWTK